MLSFEDKFFRYARGGSIPFTLPEVLESDIHLRWILMDLREGNISYPSPNRAMIRAVCRTPLTKLSMTKFSLGA